MRFILIFCVLLAPVYNFCQITISGKVVDKLTKLPIPYSTLWIIGTNDGCYSDKNGDFSLLISNNDINSIIELTCVGYESRKILFDSAKNLKIFQMIPIKLDLPEIVVQPSSKTLKPGKFNVKNPNYYFGSNLPIELASELVFDDYQVNLGKRIHTISIKVKPDIGNDLCRLQLYESDEQRKPGRRLLHTSIFLNKSDIIKNVITINILDHNIFVDDKFIFVGLEWLPNQNKQSKDSHSFRPGITHEIKNANTYTRILGIENYTWTKLPLIDKFKFPPSLVLAYSID